MGDNTFEQYSCSAALVISSLIPLMVDQVLKLISFHKAKYVVLTGALADDR